MATGSNIADPLIGTLLDGRYRVDATIGSGGMSTVYRAFDTKLERDVAVKVMHAQHLRDPAFLERFRREARAVAQISHQHVVSVIDAGEDDGHPYIVFEFIEGEDLKQHIRREGPLPVPEAVAYAIEVARALLAAHARKLVHRDVKPQNVLIDPDGHARVTDFGIARSLEAAEAGLTATGRVLGSTDYVSPEQALGRDVDGQTDIYSLGILLYEMLTGEVPFKADTQVGVALKHVREGLPDVRRKRPEVSAALAATIERATAKECADRYADIGELLRDLEDDLAYEASRAGEVGEEATTVLRALPDDPYSGRTVPARIRRPWLVPVTAVVVAVIVIGVAAVLATRTERGTGGGPVTSSGGLRAVSLTKNGVRDYDPVSDGGDGSEHPNTPGLVLDGNPQTAWTTETYTDSPAFANKKGVGLTINASPGVAARELSVKASQGGYRAEVRAANGVPQHLGGWKVVSPNRVAARDERFKISTGGRRYDHYLLWITRLTGKGPYKVSIAEIRLFR